jgi:hypothetical protein
MSRAREVSKIVETVDLVENSIDNIDLSATITTASSAAVAYLVDGAPEALNTLAELSAALNDDQNFATTVTNELSNKLSISSASATYLPQASASATYLPLTGGSISGNLLSPNRTSFVAYSSVRQVIPASTWTKVNLNTTRFNNGNNFNTSTSKFIAPVQGIYLSQYTINFDSATSGYLYSGIKVNNVFYHYGDGRNVANWNSDNTLGNSQIVFLNQGDEIELWSYSGVSNGVAAGLERTSLGIYLLG